jgi:hypothetical protein
MVANEKGFFEREGLDVVAQKYLSAYDAGLLRAVIQASRSAYQPALTKERFEAKNGYLLFGWLIKTPQSFRRRASRTGARPRTR